MNALIMLAMMQVAPQDTIRGEFEIPVPRQEVGELEPVEVSVVVQHEPMDTAFLRQLHENGAASAEAAFAQYVATCGCVSAGPPTAFWYGLLLLGAYAVKKWSDDGVVINVNSNSEASASSEGGDGGDADADADARIEPPDDCYPGR